jgi:acetyl-CoA carboxylase biotin carboxyl carrier protein
MTADKDRFGLDDVRALAQVLRDFDLGELELSHASGERIRMVRAQGLSPATAVHPVYQVPAIVPSVAPGPAQPAAATASKSAGPQDGESATAAAPAKNVFVVSAPLVGTFYRAAGPDAAAFTDLGQRVRKGQTLCIIEAMKLMNELESEVDGTVVACLVENGRPVEYGQPLFHIQRDKG